MIPEMKSATSDSRSQEKTIVKDCLAVLRKDEASAKQIQRIKRRMSIRQLRAVTSLDLDDAGVQQRALTDAAEALAMLWKVSSPKRVLVPNRVIRYSR